MPNSSKVFYVFLSKQSFYVSVTVGLAATHDFIPEIMNYRLGGGRFCSQLTQQYVRGKGYTYGIGSSFTGSTIKGPFAHIVVASVLMPTNQ
jgi:zinc protease